MTVYLIAHKVRGKAAFDIAEKIVCPECLGEVKGINSEPNECCTGGHWWIVSTSKQRAHPYWRQEIASFGHHLIIGSAAYQVPLCPDNWPDHVSDDPA